MEGEKSKREVELLFRLWESIAYLDLFKRRVEERVSDGELCKHELRLCKSFKRRWNGLRNRVLLELIPYWETRCNFPTGPSGTEVEPGCSCRKEVY